MVYCGSMEIDDPNEEHFGPKMLKLTPLQRRFVWAVLNFPGGKDWQIAKAAGYSTNSHGALRVQAHVLFHSEKVIAALHEEASKRLRSSSVLGVSILVKIAQTDGHRDQLRAAEALLNRVGLHEMTEHKVTVDHRDETGEAMIGRVAALAKKLGIDPAVLLGGGEPVPKFHVKQIEGMAGAVIEAEEVKDAG